ncbi:thioesterase II family protein [Streptomyces sp. NPDC096136]|uniref:thioesterase II family protein n=1 Tax=Streptomyces sp. NPDC096136 TaxID=3366076 RepID=UPI0038255AD9
MNDWLVNIAPAPQAPLRVVVFPHAGGQPSFYARALGTPYRPKADVWAVQPPGRGSRTREQPISDLTRLTRMTARTLAATQDDRPTAFFGHSSGGIYAFETARALARAGRPPRRLGISAIPAPDHPYWEDTLPALLANPDEAYRRLGAGAIPGELDHDQQAMTAFIRLIRADARLYQALGRRPPTAMEQPVSTFAATADLIAPPTEMLGWHNWTSATCTAHHYEGDHFYIAKQLRTVIEDLANDIDTCPPWGAGEPGSWEVTPASQGRHGAVEKPNLRPGVDQRQVRATSTDTCPPLPSSVVGGSGRPPRANSAMPGSTRWCN